MKSLGTTIKTVDSTRLFAQQSVASSRRMAWLSLVMTLFAPFGHVLVSATEVSPTVSVLVVVTNTSQPPQQPLRLQTSRLEQHPRRAVKAMWRLIVANRNGSKLQQQQQPQHQQQPHHHQLQQPQQQQKQYQHQQRRRQGGSGGTCAGVCGTCLPESPEQVGCCCDCECVGIGDCCAGVAASCPDVPMNKVPAFAMSGQRMAELCPRYATDGGTNSIPIFGPNAIVW